MLSNNIITKLNQNQLQQYFDIDEKYFIDDLFIKYNLLDPYTHKPRLTCKATNKLYINKKNYDKSVKYLHKLQHLAEIIDAQELHIKWHFIQNYGIKNASTIYLHNDTFLIDSNSKLSNELYFYQEAVTKYKSISTLLSKINSLTEKNLIDIYLQILLITDALQYSHLFLKNYNFDNFAIKKFKTPKKLTYYYYNNTIKETINIFTKYKVIFTDFSVLTENEQKIDPYRLQNFNIDIITAIKHLDINIFKKFENYYNNDLLINYLKNHYNNNFISNDFLNILAPTLEEYQHSIEKVNRVINNFSYNKLLTRYESRVNNILTKSGSLMSINNILNISRLFNINILLHNLPDSVLLTNKFSSFKNNIINLKLYIDKLIIRKQKQYTLLNNIDQQYYNRSFYHNKLNKLTLISKNYNNIIKQVNILLNDSN
jgi:hypothetical protein